jgi:hypothetical protein
MVQRRAGRDEGFAVDAGAEVGQESVEVGDGPAVEEPVVMRPQVFGWS